MKEDWKKIVEHFGLDEQIKHWFSEQYELVQAIERDDGTIECRKHIVSELADNFNFLKQIQVHYEITDEEVEEEQRFKNKRTLNEVGNETFTGYKWFVAGNPVMELEFDNTGEQEEKPIQELKNRKFTRNQKQIAGKINELIKAVNELKNK